MTDPLRVVLGRYPAVIRPITPPEPLGNAGGLSGASLWRFATGRGPHVVRCWPVDGPDLAHLEQIQAWLAPTSDLGFVPVPIPTLDGRSIVVAGGRNWEVAPWMPGTADLGRPPSSPRIRAAFAGLAAFHARLAAPRSDGPSPGLISRVREMDRLIQGEFETIRRALGTSAADPVVPLAKSWLSRASAMIPGFVDTLRKAAANPLPLQPCLRDARPDHFLFEGDRLTGLVDFGAMGRDSVAGDLARLMAEGLGIDRSARAEALSAYEAIRPLSEIEHRTIEAFERANALLGAGHWVRWHFLEHRVFEDPQAIEKGIVRGLERMGGGLLAST